MRTKEIITLKVGQVFLDKVVSRVPHRVASILDVVDCKNGERKAVPISLTLRKVLERRIKDRDPDDQVFLQRSGKPWTSHDGGVSKQMKLTCEKAGVPYGDQVKDSNGDLKLTPDGFWVGVTFHCFRHTRITRWVEDGWSDSIIRLASGHKDFDSYRKYVKPDDATVMRLVGGSKKVQKTAKLFDKFGSVKT